VPPGGIRPARAARDERLDLTPQVGPTLRPGEVLVVCLAHEAGEPARSILAEHGGRDVTA